MSDVWAYIQQNPIGAAVLLCAGASILTTVSALFVALRGGAAASEPAGLMRVTFM